MNFVAATLLMHLRPEEAFWCFVSLIKTYELRSYFAVGVPELVVNLYCLDRFVELFMPQLFSHFKEERVTPILFASEWFTTLYGYSFELSFTRAIWTVFFSVGKLFLFRAAMGILRLLEKDLMRLNFEKIILLLKHPPVTARDVIEEADKFGAIDDRMLARMMKEAAAHKTEESLL